jgi:hypothetical protein
VKSDKLPSEIRFVKLTAIPFQKTKLHRLTKLKHRRLVAATKRGAKFDAMMKKLDRGEVSFVASPGFVVN